MKDPLLGGIGRQAGNTGHLLPLLTSVDCFFRSTAAQRHQPKVVPARLGHRTFGITLDFCSHVLPGMHEETATKVEAALRKAMNFA